MLTDLTWIEDGRPFPPEDEDERARLEEHARNRMIYNGLHDRIFPRYIAYLADTQKDAKKQPIILDWPELATSSYLNLLLGEEPEVIAGKIQKEKEKEGQKSSSKPFLAELPNEQVFIDASRYGHAFYEISDDGIQALNPENCYLIVSPENIQKPWAFVFFRAWEEGEKDKKNKFVKFTIHTKGQIQHLVFEVIDGKLSGPRKLKDFPAFAGLKVAELDGKPGIQKPSVDDILIVHVQNQLSSERYYGRSDYKPSIVSLIESLELLFAQRAEVLRKFTNQLLQMLQLSRVLLAGKDAGTAESGTALRIRLIPTLAKVSKYARAAEKAIPKVLNLWSQLHPPVIELKDVQVRLQDGIPEDPMETAQVTQFWDAMGAVSLERKLVLQGFEEGSDAFKTELQRLQDSQQRSVPDAPGVELPGLGDEDGQQQAAE